MASRKANSGKKPKSSKTDSKKSRTSNSGSHHESATVAQAVLDSADGLASFRTKSDFDGGIHKTESVESLPPADFGVPIEPFHDAEYMKRSTHPVVTSADSVAAMRSGFQPEGIQGGVDDRHRVHNTTDFPYRAICHLEMVTKTRHTFLGTAWFVGPRTLVTAGHNVFMHQRGGYVSNILVSPGRNASSIPNYVNQSGKTRAARFTAKDWATTHGWVNGASEEFDIGVIWLDEPVGFGWFGYDAFSEDDLRRMNAAVVGYPADPVEDADIPRASMWGHGRRFTRVYPNQLQYHIDTTGGQSGAPVFFKKENGEFVGVGIHNYGGGFNGNLASRITNGVANLIDSWKTQVGD